MKQNKIDRETFARAVVNGESYASAYRMAGYRPEGDNDNAKILAQKLIKNEEVQELMEQFKAEKFKNLRELTVVMLEKFMREDYHDLSPKDKAVAIQTLAKITGVEAPKVVEVNHNNRGNPQKDAKELMDWLLETPEGQQISKQLLGTKVVGRPGDVSETQESEAKLIDQQDSPI